MIRRLLFLCSLLVSLPALADPIPADRKVDWSFTGVPGGIPTRNTICATFSPGATAAAINAAIAACNNGVVFLNAGVYTAASLGGGIIVNKTNVTLRGAGADQTIFSTGGGYVGLRASNYGQQLGTAITSGATKGSTSFVVASTTNLSVGEMIEIDRADDPALIPFFGSWSPSNGRSIVQTDVITAMSGNTITVRNPLVFDFASGTPKVKAYYPASISQSAIENMKIDLLGGSGAAIEIQSCDSCWVRGVEIKNGGNYMILVDASVNLELRDNWIHDGGVGPNHSGISFQSDYRYGCSSSAKVENNILNKAFPNIEINNCSSGLYVGYNYSPGNNGGNQDTVTFTLDDSHAAYPVMDLYEGNIVDQYGTDGFWGGAGYGTALRNYFSGYDPNVGQPKGGAVALRRIAYYFNIVGNVLGSTNQAPAGYTGCGLYSNIGYIYETPGLPNFGSCSTTNQTNDSFVPTGGYPDQKVEATLLRWGNYDYFNSATRFVSAEIPSGVAVPSDHVIPNSYVYASQPSWWPGGIPWPPIGPDITGGNGDTSGHANKIPAQICAETLNLLAGGSFNASVCYAGGTPSAPVITSQLTASGTRNSAFSYQITATANPTSFNATGLPAGLSVNTGTGLISGTPTVAGTTNVTISATNAQGTGSATLVITINAPAAPVITSSLTASGVVNSPFSYTITASNNPTSFNATGLPAGLSVNTATGVISGTPTVAGSSNVVISATNAQGTGPATLVLTINTPGTGQTLFLSTDVPAVVNFSDANSVELGVRFFASTSGKVTSVRFYKGSADVPPHSGHLWDVNGALLATAMFANETASGWQQADFASPVNITAGAIYTVSYHTSGNYAVDSGYFATDHVRGALTAPSSPSIGGNGVYLYTPNAAFPGNTSNSSNYWPDLVFIAAIPLPPNMALLPGR